MGVKDYSPATVPNSRLFLLPFPDMDSLDRMPGRGKCYLFCSDHLRNEHSLELADINLA